MADQIPDSWIGEEVTVYYAPKGYHHTGTLESVSGRGIVLRANPGTDNEYVAWYPITAVIQLIQGQPRGAEGTPY